MSEEATTPSPASEFDRKAATYIAFADRDCAEWAALFTANGRRDRIAFVRQGVAVCDGLKPVTFFLSFICADHHAALPPGTALSPTTPLAVGKVELEATCKGVLSAFATLHPILSHTIGPSSYVSGANYQVFASLSGF